MQIINHIGHGKENAVTRRNLCRLTGLSDRATREAVEQARHEGYIILNDQDGAGYYMSADLDDIERQYRQNQSRALAILHYQKPLRKALKDAGRL